MARSKEDVFALRDGKVKTQCFADLIIGALLAAAGVDEIEKRLCKSKSSSECLKCVWIVDDTACLEFSTETLQVQNDVDDDMPVGCTGFGVQVLELLLNLLLELGAGFCTTVPTLNEEIVLKLPGVLVL